MGLFDFIKGAGDDISEEELTQEERETAEKMLRAKLFRHLRNTGLEEKVEGLELEVEDDKVTVKGKVADEELAEIVVLSIGNFQGVAGVEDELTVPEPAKAEVVVEEPKKEVAVVAAAPASKPAPAPKPKPKSTFHTVVSGDTLWAISEKYLGDGNKYMAIFEANRPMLKNPDSIYPGQKLRIPK